MKKILLTTIAISVLTLTGCMHKAGNLTVLKYKVSKQDNISDHGRKRVSIEAYIKDEMADQQTLTSTCMGASKYLAEQTTANFVDMKLYDQPGEGEGHILLATCQYAADGKGKDGKSQWTWNNITAANDTTRIDVRNIAKKMGEHPRFKGETDDAYYDRIGNEMSFGVFEIKKMMSMRPIPSPIQPTTEQENIEPIPETLKDGILG